MASAPARKPTAQGKSRTVEQVGSANTNRNTNTVIKNTKKRTAAKSSTGTKKGTNPAKKQAGNQTTVKVKIGKDASKKNTGKNTGKESRKNPTAGRSTQTSGTRKKQSVSQKSVPEKRNYAKTEISDEQRQMLEYEIKFWVACGITIFFMMCNFHMCMGMGEVIYTVMHGLFGWLAYIFPLLVLLSYLFLLANRGNLEAQVKLRLGISFFVLCCGLIHLVGIKETQPFSIAFYFESGQSGINGGLTGGLLGGSLQHLIGSRATWLVLVLCMLVHVLLLTERSLVHILQDFLYRAKKRVGEVTARVKEMFSEEDEEYDDAFERDFPEDAEQESESGGDFDNYEPEQDDNRTGFRDGSLNFGDNPMPERDYRSDFGRNEVPERGYRSDFDRNEAPERGWAPDFRNNRMPERNDAAKDPSDFAKTYWKNSDSNSAVHAQAEQAVFATHRDSASSASSVPLHSSSSVQRVLIEREDCLLEEMGFGQWLSGTQKRSNWPGDTFLLYNGFESFEQPLARDRNLGESQLTETEDWETRLTERNPASPALAGTRLGKAKTAVPDTVSTGWTNSEVDSSDTVLTGWTNSEVDSSDTVPTRWTNSEVDLPSMAGTGFAESMTDSLDTVAKEAIPAEMPFTADGLEADFAECGAEEATQKAVDITAHVVLPEDGSFLEREVAVKNDAFSKNHATAKKHAVMENSAVAKNSSAAKNKTASASLQDRSIWKQNAEGNRDSSGAVTFSGKPKPPEKKRVVKKPYVFPPAVLLKRNLAFSSNLNGKHREIQKKLYETLQSFGVRVHMGSISVGPTVTRYELEPEPGVKVSRIVALQDDIKLALAASDIRIEAPIPGKSAIGIEVPNQDQTVVGFRELIDSDVFRNHSSKVAVAVGRDISGQIIVADLAKMPHLLIAGATGSGKSVCINTLIMSILYKASPEEVKLVMVDPKVVELSVYNGIPHLLVPVVTDARKAANALRWAVDEMNDRYRKFAEHNVRNLEGYNEQLKKQKAADPSNEEEYLYQMVIIVDELADLMMVAQSEVEEAICRLAQMARAAGIHLVLATQRPSVNVITGLIKANVPSRIAFAVSSGVDSRTIIDMNGAEKLLGKGDMLFYPYGLPKPIRVQGAFISDQEVSKVVSYLHQNNGEPSGQEQMEQMITSAAEHGAVQAERDEYFEKAAYFILEKEKASIGALQRNFKIGFNRAARIMDQLAAAGVVSEEDGTKPRRILINLDELKEILD